MKAGYHFFQRLMSPLLVERRQLHSQVCCTDRCMVDALGSCQTRTSAAPHAPRASNHHARGNSAQRSTPRPHTQPCSTQKVGSSIPTFSAVTFLQGVQLPHQQPDVSHPGASSAASCSVGTVSAAHSDQGARLQEQREQAAKLRVLSKKDSYLRGAMALYIQGCLSWVQQAKLRIAMVRRPVPVVSIATRAQKMRAGRAWG
mgnify:FL=1